MSGIIRGLGWVLFSLLTLAGAAWAITAMWLHLTGPVLWIGLALVALGGVAAFVARRRKRRIGWGVLALCAGLVVLWYQTIDPREDRDWAIDVSRGVKAQVDGDLVTLTDIRDFDWRTRDDAEHRWTSRTYDLRQLQSLDMLTSVWDSPDIAHLLVSFGFADGEHVVFSVEIRREAHEVFNELGGFFRQFEMVLIGATERDIVKLRTNHRQEQVSLFPVTLDAAQRRKMFMSYVTLAQKLEAKPQWYNTLMANCTTVVYRLARVLKDDLPINIRLVLSGQLPEYLDDLGVLGGEGDMQQRRQKAMITPLGQAAAGVDDFSAAIRGR